MISTVTAKGQVTLPVKARRKLGIRAGTKLDFVIKDNDRLEVIVISGSIKNLKGMLPKPKRALTLAEMDHAIRERAVSRPRK
jgi:antitoxin PrlF